ncbi:MAG: peroxide stress protein YaaA [Saprospiraceae bacterium]|nr:peroxide stress protein YaaA [Saprospiraceae bacterium]
MILVKTLAHLSGLYGLLSVPDLIQEYRLEMGCGLKVGKSKKKIYTNGFWEKN